MTPRWRVPRAWGRRRGGGGPGGGEEEGGWRRPVGAAGAAGDEGCDGGLAPDLDRGGGRGKGIGAGGGASEVGRLGFLAAGGLSGRPAGPAQGRGLGQG